MTVEQFGVSKIRIRQKSHIPRVVRLCRYSQLIETSCHDPDRTPFSVTDQLIQRLGRQFLNHFDAHEHALTFVQQVVDFLHGRFGISEFVHRTLMECANGVDANAALQCKFTSRQQIIRRLSHGRTNDGPRTISFFDLTLNQLGNVIDTFGIGQRRATKFKGTINFLLFTIVTTTTTTIVNIAQSSFVILNLIGHVSLRFRIRI
mmetsp:Transcript_8827/g.14182  ORF Transcript_8827/g.14182 Transcript_8827/m.14182 type:complete len:204 (-) Transcript_8827:73-684(-)